ncbi:MAG: response regulator [Rhodocyclales bacterium]|nr:response regulator [Rhodocyclales bacterium]
MTFTPRQADTSRATGQPELDESVQTFLRLAIIAIIGCALAFIAVILIFTPEQTWRIANPMAGLGIALTAWVLLKTGQTRAGIAVLAYGSWAAVTVIAITTGGIRTPVVFSLPVVIFFAGWILGPRAAIALAALSVMTYLALAMAEQQSWLPPSPPTPPYMHWVVQATIFSLAAATIVHLRHSHAHQVEEVRALTAELTRQRAEAAAAESLLRNQDLLDRTGALAHVGGWEVEVASHDLTWTAETFRIHDLEPGPMPSVDQAIAFYPPEARSTIEANVASAMTEGKGYDIELPLITATGRRIWVRALCKPRMENGKVVRLSGAVQDITAQRDAAQALRTSLNNLQRTLEATDEGIFGYDGNDPSGKLLFANDRLFEIWKIPPQDRASTGRAEIIAAARKLFVDPEAGVKRIGEILAMGVVHEDKVSLNDGRVLFRRSIPLLEGSQVSRVWSFRDITAEERAKAELIASRDQAQRASAAKSEFLSRMSHELRTPMHAIMGMMSLARRRMEDAKGLEHLDKAKAAADHLLSVINDILDISKIEAGRLELEQVDFQLADVLRNLDNMVAGKAADKGLILTLDHDPLLAERPLRGDPLRIGQILLNLVGNAIKFSERGDISLRTQFIEESVDHTRLRFDVCDQGIGLAPEVLDRLFVAFEQADGSMTRRFGGTGLGLAISKRLVRMMEGEIGVDSTPGRGSRFWFTVRLGRPHAEIRTSIEPHSAAAIENELRRRFAGSRVLLADDDPAGREVATAMLRDAGLVIDAADDGAQALQLAQGRDYHLILMDMRMPCMNGVDAAAAIRADSRNRDTTIVALTANAFAEDRQTCLAAGMNDHIAKPVEASVLYSTLLHWLSRENKAG